LNPKQTEKGRIMKQKPRLILFVAVFYLLFFITLSPLWGDVAAVKGALKEKGDNFVIVKVSKREFSRPVLYKPFISTQRQRLLWRDQRHHL